jgi:hypothetical protein
MHPKNISGVEIATIGKTSSAPGRAISPGRAGCPVPASWWKSGQPAPAWTGGLPAIAIVRFGTDHVAFQRQEVRA